MTFGEKLRAARTSNKMTQKELVEKIGAKHNSISNWENDQNRPDPDTIELICGILNITPHYLLSAHDGALSVDEKELLDKYRSLGFHGKQIINTVMDIEYERLEFNASTFKNENFYPKEKIRTGNSQLKKQDHLVLNAPTHELTLKTLKKDTHMIWIS